MGFEEFYSLLTQATLQVQAGVAVDEVIQSLLTQVQQGWEANHISLYRDRQKLLTTGEPLENITLPDTWQAQKIPSESGEIWCWPVLVRQQGWGWLVGHWTAHPKKKTATQGELLTAHISLIIRGTQPVNHRLHLPSTEDEPYHFLLNTLPVGVALTDAAGRCIYVNRYLAEQLWQMPPAEMLGSNWVDAIHPDDRQRVLQTWERAVHTPPHEYAEEYRLQRRDGSLVWIQDRALVIGNPDAGVAGFICISVNITETKELQIMLSKSEQKYRQIVDYQTDFLLYSLPDKMLTYANPSLYHQMGYNIEQEEMIGLAWEQVVPDAEDLRILEEKIQQLTPQNPIFTHTKPIRGKQGQILYVEWINLGIFDEQGTLLSIQSIGRDVTALRQAEAEIKESREQFATLLQNMPGMVYRYHAATDDQPHYFSYVSDYAEEIFELTPAQIIENPSMVWMNFIHPEDLDLLLTSIQTAIAQSVPWYCQWRIITPTGKLKWLEGRSQMRRHNNEQFWDGICIDITEQKNTLLELEKQRQFSHQIVTATKAVIYIYDLEENHNIFANPECELVLGYSAAEIQAMGSELLPTLVHPEDWPQVRAQLERLPSLGDDEEVQIAYRIRTKSGECRWLLSRDRVLKRNTQGQPQQMLGVATDITELKEAELALAASQKLLESILTHLPVTVWRYQLWPDGREALPYVSSGCEKIYGISSEQAQQNIQALWDLVVQDDLPHLQERSTQSQINLTPFLCEFRIVTPKGELKWLRGQGQPERQADGSTVWDSIFIDITPRKQAELALQQLNQELEQRIQQRTLILQQQAQEEGLLRLIIETIHESLDIEQTLPIVLDETRTTLACDRVVVYQFNPDWSGYFLAESVADGWVPVVTGAMTTLSDHCLQETQGGRFQQHYILVSNDIYQSGFTPCHIALLEQFQARAQIIIPIFLETKLWGLLAAYQNSAPRIWQTNEIEILKHVGLHIAIALRQSKLYKASQVQVVELQKLNKLKDEFLSTVSHELRSPMHNIGMAIKMLELRLQRAGILDDLELGIERYLDILKSATQREIELINDLLDLARLNADAIDLIFEPVDVPHILEQILPAIEERTRTQHQHFISQPPAQFYPLRTHATSLERILQELLHNACKYTPQGETITLAIEYEPVNYCTFRIINTGVEIPPEEHARVFDNFYRIPNHDPWQHGGTGLGLALVKKLVERLQGEIHLISENQRTEFRVSLPLIQPTEST